MNILRFIDAWLAFTILGIEVSFQVSGYIEQFSKYTEQIDLNPIQYLKSDGSFILYNNLCSWR